MPKPFALSAEASGRMPLAFPNYRVVQLTVLPIVVQFVVVGAGRTTTGAGDGGGGMYCCPTNLNSGSFPSDGPQAYVM